MKSNVTITIVKTDRKALLPFHILYSVDKHHLDHLLSFYNISAKSSIHLPLWLTKVIIFFLSHFPLTWLSVKKLQDLITQLHNNIELNQGTSKSLLVMIAKNHYFLSRYYLTCMHHDIENGVPFSKAILHFFEDENPFYASLIQEAENGSKLKMILNNISNMLLIKASSRFQLIRIVLPALIAIIICLYIGKELSYNITGARYNQILYFHNFFPELYSYSNLMALYESIFQVDHFYSLIAKISFFMFLFILSFNLFRASRFYPKLFYMIELNIPFIAQKQKKLISIELFKLIAISRLSNMNIYQSLHRAKLNIKNTYINSKIDQVLSKIDDGHAPLNALKSISIIPIRTHYLLDRLVNSQNQHDLLTVSELCSKEYDLALKLLNETYRLILIVIVIGLISFIGLNFIDNNYYYNLMNNV